MQLSGLAALGAVQDSQFSNSATFSATYRLLRADGFGQVIRSENIADRYFKIFFARNDRSNARLGIVASKKILSRAVDRNRVKRIIREVFRQHNIKHCKLDMVVMVRRDTLQSLDMQIDNLERLLSQVVSRCAK